MNVQIDPKLAFAIGSGLGVGWKKLISVLEILHRLISLSVNKNYFILVG